MRLVHTERKKKTGRLKAIAGQKVQRKPLFPDRLARLKRVPALRSDFFSRHFLGTLCAAGFVQRLPPTFGVEWEGSVVEVVG